MHFVRKAIVLFHHVECCVNRLLDRPINTTFTIYPSNPKLNQVIQLNCSAIGNPPVIIYRFLVNETSIGNSTTGRFSVNVSDCSKYSGYFKCIPVNVLGEGTPAQQFLTPTGMLFHMN